MAVIQIFRANKLEKTIFKTAGFCSWKILAGYHYDCQSAVREARKHDNQVNGCYHCSEACHTG
ncbi:hypothetical protein LS482_08870 [Sinomicrobium kalidii]|uniref:hypothetical protein n=1 Tax=Sinomicrobium kalidii TaxID=2900738 RepID=UPI001E2A5A4D|nr:hypothetical protein [Sinomicrobium kalidii]UGU17980.1 hypothetical protein LS482_08870 [Sinomicrobium kalidii]